MAGLPGFSGSGKPGFQTLVGTLFSAQSFSKLTLLCVPVSRRSIRNSPLCWLTWHGELKAATFLVNAGWQLRAEHWLSLPGKNDNIERFLVVARAISSAPDTLRGHCRTTIRNHLRIASDDRDIVPLIMQLPLPSQIHRYLTLDSEYDLFC